jgi:cell division protein FtsQ
VTRRVLLAVVALAAAVAAAVYLLKVTTIEVVGSNAISPGDVLAASGLHGGERILWMRTGSVAARIERFPSVQSVAVDRTLPGTIVIRVTERAALVVLGRGLAADASGIAFAYPPNRGLPTMVGWRAPARPGAVLDNGSRAVLTALASFPRALRERVRQISLLGAVTMTLSDGTQIRFGQPTDLLDKARAALAVLDDAKKRHEILAYDDVRAPTVPASRERTPPTPSPGTSPQPSTQPSSSP